MIGCIKTSLRRFLGDETGSAVLPFALWTPLMLGIALSTIEVGALTIRTTQLERALDETVRTIRLNTDAAYTHEQIKTMICEGTTTLVGCEDTLRLEMVSLDMRDWVDPASRPDCVDTTFQQVTPQRTFSHGIAHEMMLLRACYMYTSFSPASYLAKALPSDDQGYNAIVATAAFVHEPSAGGF